MAAKPNELNVIDLNRSEVCQGEPTHRQAHRYTGHGQKSDTQDMTK